jgi:hypothetical protein
LGAAGAWGAGSRGTGERKRIKNGVVRAGITNWALIFLAWRAEAEEHKDLTYVSQVLDLTDEYKSLYFLEI